MSPRDHEFLAKVGTLCEGYPLRGQADSDDPIICAKLYWPIGDARWYICGYNPETYVAYGFVNGGGGGRWGYFSVASLLETCIAGVMPAKLDEGFVPTRASTLGITHHGADS